jgi:hypothetical protein
MFAIATPELPGMPGRPGLEPFRTNRTITDVEQDIATNNSKRKDEKPHVRTQREDCSVH